MPVVYTQVMLITWLSVKRHWAEVVLAICGLAAVAVLVKAPFRARKLPGAKHPQGCGSWSASQPDRKRAEARRLAIRTLGVEAVPVILRDVPNEGPFHFDTVCALSQLGPRAVPSLVAALDDAHMEVRLVALRTLSCLAPQIGLEADSIVPAIAQVLSESNTELRYAAVLLLGRLRASGAPAVPGLIDALKDRGFEPDEDPVYVRQGAAYVLGKIGPKAMAAIPELTNTLKDANSGAQQEAAIALWRISRDTNLVIPYLSRMMIDTNVNLRQQAATAWARIRRDIDMGQVQAQPSGKAILN